MQGNKSTWYLFSEHHVVHLYKTVESNDFKKFSQVK